MRPNNRRPLLTSRWVLSEVHLTVRLKWILFFRSKVLPHEAELILICKRSFVHASLPKTAEILVQFIGKAEGKCFKVLQ